MSRAIIFDLDETLYPERRFVVSGFAAVAREVERRFEVPARDAFSVLRAALVAGRRDRALQSLCARFGLPLAAVDHLLTTFRAHAPRLRLPADTVRVLAALRPGWRLGILTNGLPLTQANKVAALGVADRVDAVVYAEALGHGKPHPRAFEVVLDRLGVRAADAVFVGDDPWCDVFGARRAGMKTIRIRRGRHARMPVSATNDADVVVASIGEVPINAVALLAGVRVREREHVV